MTRDGAKVTIAGLRELLKTGRIKPRSAAADQWPFGTVIRSRSYPERKALMVGHAKAIVLRDGSGGDEDGYMVDIGLSFWEAEESE